MSKFLVLTRVPECNITSPYTPVIPKEKTQVKPNGHSITEIAQTVDKEQKHLPRKHFLHTVA